MKVRQKIKTSLGHGDQVVRNTRHVTRTRYSAEEKIRIVMLGLRGFGGRHCVTACAATPTEVKNLRWEARHLKEVVEEQAWKFGC